MSDAFLVLAQAPGGLSCFLLPRIREDDTRNGIRIQRLKDKLENRANASSEVEYEDAVATRLGEEGRDVRTIIDMVARARLDCILGSTAGVRPSTAQPDAAARRLVTSFALALQVSLLVPRAPAAVPEAFCATRLSGDPFGGALYDALPPGLDVALSPPVRERPWPRQRRSARIETTEIGGSMSDRFNVGDHVGWNSEAGHVSGRIVKVHTADFDYKGHTHRASEDDPQYEIKSDKTDHVAAHKGSALKRLSD